jgi:Secretion system C-terminal sorting domain
VQVVYVVVRVVYVVMRLANIVVKIVYLLVKIANIVVRGVYLLVKIVYLLMKIANIVVRGVYLLFHRVYLLFHRVYFVFMNNTQKAYLYYFTFFYMKIIIQTVCFLLFLTPCVAQFSGVVGTANCAAIYQDSSVFVAWATGCKVVRGYQNAADTTLGRVNFGNDSSAVGKAGVNGVVSLGDGGSAILTFAKPIRNGVGADFAVFENSFDNAFLELAFVEVSSNGVDFYRFRATSNLVATQIGAFDLGSNATKINNLAGKYRARYGTPFDLAELAGVAGLNINAITHVKIIDVVGSINPLYASYDQNNNAINDPYPTPFASGGFDLDAVGVLHQATVFAQSNTPEALVFPCPLPQNQVLTVQANSFINSINIYAINGALVYQHIENNSNVEYKLPILALAKGVYILNITTDLGIVVRKIVVL